MENFATYRLTQTGPETQAILDQVNENTTDIAQLRALYEALTQSEPVIIQPSDTWPVADPEENVIYRVIDRVNTPPESYSDYMWNGTAMVLMATYDNAIDSTPTAGSNNPVASGGVLDYVSTNGSAYDISAAHSGTAYEDLAAALGTDGANVPAAVRKGGMSVKFVQTSSNKYVQYRLMKNEWSTTVSDWQGVTSEVKVGSKDLVESDAVASAIDKISGISKIDAPDDNDYIVIEDSNDNTVVEITPNGVNAKNLKSNGVDVLTENDRDDFATVEDVNEIKETTENIVSGGSLEDGEYLLFGANDGSETFVRIDGDGVKAKSFYDMNGNKLEPSIREIKERKVPLSGFLGHNSDSKQYKLFISYGQSLSTATDTESIGYQSIQDTYMLGSISPSFSASLSALSSVHEEPVLGFVQSYAKLVRKNGLNENYIAASCGKGGASIAQLSKASRIAEYAVDYDYPIADAGSYESKFLDALNKAVSATSDNVECPAIIYLQGERDYYSDDQLGPVGDDSHNCYSCGGDKDMYKARMRNLADDMQNDVMSILGQDYKPIFIIYSCYADFVGNDNATINMAQIEFAQENDDVLLIGSPYFCPKYSQNGTRYIHLSTNGSRWLSEYIAKSFYERNFLGLKEMPILPEKIWIEENSIYIKCGNVHGNLVADTHIVESITNYGFSVTKDGQTSSSYIKSITFDGDVIIIECYSLSCTHLSVSYGALPVRGMGNVRDCNLYVSLADYWNDASDNGYNNDQTILHYPTDMSGNSLVGKKYPMYNWLDIFSVQIK